MKKTGRIITAAALLALASPIGAFAADKIALTMNWRADSAHLGFAMAQKMGFYADEGLEVDLQEGRGSSVAAQLVATGATSWPPRMLAMLVLVGGVGSFVASLLSIRHGVARRGAVR